ncbi:hypothetical protein ISS86_02855 [Candidatus Microgenomates bacterium]|nr:hypothetical protein [Candidatus Microgenomates bacterium]
MLKTYLYVPDHLEEQIKQTAEFQKKSKAEVMRQALEKGIITVQQQGTASAEVLLKLAELGKRHRFQGPKDSSERIDELLWRKDWSKDE